SRCCGFGTRVSGARLKQFGTRSSVNCRLVRRDRCRVTPSPGVCRGKKVRGTLALTPALSPRERESLAASLENCFDHLAVAALCFSPAHLRPPGVSASSESGGWFTLFPRERVSGAAAQGELAPTVSIAASLPCTG